MCMRMEVKHGRLGETAIRDRLGRENNDSGKQKVRCVQRRGWKAWRQGMEIKNSLEWYRLEEMPDSRAAVVGA